MWDPRQKDTPVVNMEPLEGETKRDCWTVAFGKIHIFNNGLAIKKITFQQQMSAKPIKCLVIVIITCRNHLTIPVYILKNMALNVLALNVL